MCHFLVGGAYLMIDVNTGMTTNILMNMLRESTAT